MKTLYIECNMGAAGDMLMGALYELLEDKTGFVQTMNSLGLPGVRVTPKAAATCGIAGTHMEVTVYGAEEDHHHHHDHHHDHHHATPGYIGALIAGLPLPGEVKLNARAVYDDIAHAEAKAHGCAVGDVHFHEVGALDAVADVAGVCYALHLLEVDSVVVSPIHVGSGTVRCQHGVMPVPAPATAALLTGVPSYGGAVQGELCTPTGAALLAHFADSFGAQPLMRVAKTGVGCGTRVFAQANCVRAFLGESVPNKLPADSSDSGIVELVCNLDDMTPEALAFACSALLSAGALDVYTTPGTMKKGRPGWELTVLCPPAAETAMAQEIMRQTTTNGVRARHCGKYFLAPGSAQVQTEYGTVGVKLAEGYGIRHAKPEFEDAAVLARANGLPYQTVTDAVRKQL